MYKVAITKREYSSHYGCNVVFKYVSIDAVKPFEIANDEWESLKMIVEEIANGGKHFCRDYCMDNCTYDLYCISNDRDWQILAESEHFYIRCECEEAFLYRKPDSKKSLQLDISMGILKMRI